LAATLARPVGHLLLGPLAKYRAIDAVAIARALVRVALDARPASGVTIYESDRIATLGEAPAR
jgi:hypothetical protein